MYLVHGDSTLEDGQIRENVVLSRCWITEISLYYVLFNIFVEISGCLPGTCRAQYMYIFCTFQCFMLSSALTFLSSIPTPAAMSFRACVCILLDQILKMNQIYPTSTVSWLCVYCYVYLCTVPVYMLCAVQELFECTHLT